MQQPMREGGRGVDEDLLLAFETEVLAKAPHVEGGRVLNPTPLVELTQAMKDCAREEYGLELSGRNFVVYGKLEAKLMGGSVKSRAAIQIIHKAIMDGRLKRGMVVFEATSGTSA